MLDKNIKVLTWFNFFSEFKLYAPVAIIYFTQVSGSFALGMSIFSIVMISSALLEIPTGIFSDRIGRRKTVMIGAFSAVACTIFYAIGMSFWILVVGAIFEGLARSFYSGNNDALLHDTLSEKNQEHLYQEHLGKVSAMFQVALAVAAILGSLLASWSFPLIMWLSVIPQLVCVSLSFFLREPRNHQGKSGNIYQHITEAYANFITNKKLRLVSLSSILGYGFGEASHNFRAAFFVTLWPIWALGLISTLSNIFAALSFHYSGKIIQRFKIFQLFITDNLYSRIVNIISTLFPSILSPILMSTSSLFYGATTVGRNALMQKEFTNEQRATMGSLNAFAGSIFFGIVAFCLGLTADRLSPAQALLLLQVFQFGNLFIYWKLFKYHR